MLSQLLRRHGSDILYDDSSGSKSDISTLIKDSDPEHLSSGQSDSLAKSDDTHKNVTIRIDDSSVAPQLINQERLAQLCAIDQRLNKMEQRHCKKSTDASKM